MASVGAEYSHLHSLHMKLKDVLEQLAKGPRQIKVRQTRISEAEQKHSASEQELKGLKSEADRKNLDLKTKEAHLAELESKLNTAASNREYDILKGHISADKAAKAVLEDEVIEYLDRIDAHNRNLLESRNGIETLKSDCQKYADDFEVKAVELRDREKNLRAKISEVETIIPKEMRTQYQRLVDAYGADAMASSENGMCNQCFVQLTPQNRVLVNSGKLLICSVCGRLMYPVPKE